jgi:Hemerythrin HHE cation binding domain
MTSIAQQDEAALGGPLSILVRQKRDHIELDRLLHELGSTDGEAQQDVLTRLNRLVFSHAFAEEGVLWPVLRRVLPDGEALTLHVEREHQEVNELVVRLEHLDQDQHVRDPDERRRLLDRLVTVLREDVRDEEDELLPRLQEALSVRALVALGVAWEAVRRTAPTRPHPVVARRPPGNLLSSLPLSVLDRSRDSVDRLARRSDPGRATTLRSVSRSLAGAAGRVEQLPVMQRGERADTHRAS